MAACGVSDFVGFWVATDGETRHVLGTTGLYVYNRDTSEAVWLAWFCVAPAARGHGIGSRLLDFSIDEARRTNRRYLRLYTSDDEREAAAQPLYESRGLRAVRKRWRLLYTEIYRELSLEPRSGGRAV
jgi:GNAT superfamily N-acetyltransferase